jgi:hypothetical protein
MAPRITKASQEILDTFGFEISEPPEKDNSRVSKYDPRWDAARTFLMENPGRTIKVRTYPSASAAYSDAKAINNGDHRKFKGESKNWTAVSAKSDNEDDVNETTGERLYALWLTYNESE